MDKEQEAAWPAVRAAKGVGKVASCTSCTTGDAARSLNFGTKPLYATRKAMAMQRGTPYEVKFGLHQIWVANARAAEWHSDEA